MSARNTATDSSNRIHDDTTARRFGFHGGLVPGVDVFAYMAHVPVAVWGLDWLSHGTLEARFLSPVYDGDEVTIHLEPDPPGRVAELELRDPRGSVAATGEMTLPAAPEPAPGPDDIPAAPLPGSRQPASPHSLAPGTVLGSVGQGFRADRAGPYLDDIGESLALFRDEGFAHPGWLLRGANTLLVANVELGPWIHVGSLLTNHAAVRDGDHVETRGQVVANYERRGHRFVELEVTLRAAPGRQGAAPAVVAARIHHIAIYEPRQVTDPGAPGG